MKIVLYLLFLITFLYSSEIYYYKNNQKQYLIPIKSPNNLRTIDINKQYFKTKTNRTIAIDKTIIIKSKDTNISSLLDKYNLNLKTKLTNSIYLLEVNSTNELFNILESLHNEPSIKYAHPNFYKRVEKR